MLVIVCGLAAGGLLSQAPEFAQQYSQRLGGRIDELARFVAQFERDAGRFGLTRAQAVEEFRRPGSPFLKSRGDDAALMIARYERYTAHKAQLDGAGPFARLAVLARDLEPDIGSATLRDFRPAVPVSTEGAVLAAAGFLGGGALAAALARLLRRRPRPARA